MKNIILFMFIYLLASSTLLAQKGSKPNRDVSIFSNFEELGIAKDSFIGIYGSPTSKKMRYNENKQREETLCYVENMERDKFLILSEFVFISNQLVEQKSEIITLATDKETLEQMLNDLTFIRHRVQLKLVP